MTKSVQKCAHQRKGRGGKIGKTPQAKKPPAIDRRKQLFNDAAVGPIEKIQVSTERITQSLGIMFDLDPGNYRRSALLPKIPKDPAEFYKQVTKRWLARHPILEKAEVRMTGTGLHAVLWLNSPIVFEQDGDRERWAITVQIVQAALPIDPDQPGITATTRVIGSINSKNGAKVKWLKKGTPVSADEVEGLRREMVEAPFRTVLQILAGSDQVSPCPLCGSDGTTLKALDHVGNCYGSCGKVKLEQLYDLVLAPRTRSEEQTDA